MYLERLVATVKFTGGGTHTQLWPVDSKDIMESHYDELMATGDIAEWWVR